ncbi:ATP-binding cassette domain-containing protein [bacterium]|nr:ATP-binding cassette domain-containing protein [bacterium]
MLKLSNVTKRFGALIAVNDLSLEVEKGKIYGIAGPNGAGKSTIYNLISGFYNYEGKIEFNGKSISNLHPYQIVKRGISRTFQIPQTFPSLSVEDSIDIGNRFGNTRRYRRKKVDEIINFVGLHNERKHKTGTLDLLGKKKLMIGAALATGPKLFMLDEPMAGSNAHEIKDLMKLIQKINIELGITIIIIEHFMKVLTELTETLLIIETGSEICCGNPSEVTSNPEVIECYLGTDHD